jgi:hypothetical protein
MIFIIRGICAFGHVHKVKFENAFQVQDFAAQYGKRIMKIGKLEVFNIKRGENYVYN